MKSGKVVSDALKQKRHTLEEKRTAFLEKSARRALTRAASKQAKPLTGRRLGRLKVQTMALRERLLALAGAILAGCGAAASVDHENRWICAGFAVAALFLLFVCVVGSRRALEDVKERLPDAVFEAILNSIFR